MSDPNRKRNLLSANRRKILREYIKKETANGRIYFKAKDIGKDTGLSNKQIGGGMRMMVEDDSELEIERWGYSKSTTWKITLKD